MTTPAREAALLSEEELEQAVAIVTVHTRAEGQRSLDRLLAHIAALTRARDEARAEIEWHKAKSAERHETEAGYLRAIREEYARGLEEAAGIAEAEMMRSLQESRRAYGSQELVAQWDAAVVCANNIAAAIRAAKEKQP